MRSDLHGTIRGPALLVVNPAAGRGRASRAAERLEAALRARGVVCTRADTTGPGHARALAGASDGLVVAIGGDGTVHEVVDGMPVRDGAIGPLAVLPCGSGDDFAGGLALTNDPAELAARLAGPVRTIDVGVATFPGDEDDDGGGATNGASAGSGGDGARDGAQAAGGASTRVRGAVRERFANAAAFGLDAEVAARARQRRVLRGKLLYTAATLAVLRAPTRVRATLTFTPGGGAPAHTVTTELAFASACNGPLVGGGMRFAPATRADDGLLHVVHCDAASGPALAWLLTKLLVGRHLGDRRVHVTPCVQVRIDADAPVAVALDGEPRASRPRSVTFAIAAERLLLAGAVPRTRG